MYEKGFPFSAAGYGFGLCRAPYGHRYAVTLGLLISKEYALAALLLD